MATCTLQNVFDNARAYLGDTQVAGGEVFTNSVLQPHFAEPYRKMFNCLMGVSKKVQRVVYVNLPPSTTVLIPSTYNITDMDEPEMVEERPATANVSVTSTDTSTPIKVTAPNHGLTTNAEIIMTGVANTSAPWGQWFVTVIDANTFSLNGSASDGVAGTGGTFSVSQLQNFTEVMPLDDSYQGMDGIAGQYLGVYLWINSMMQFRGSVQMQQLRITYYASGAPPTNPSQNLNIDNCLDFLAFATAANASRTKGWVEMSDRFQQKAYGANGPSQGGGLLADFISIQIMANQRGPQRRRLPFRRHISRFGDFITG